MTKYIKNLAIIAIGIFLMASCAQEKKVMLFNGKDLSNWEKVLFDSTGVPDEVFQVEDGIIKVSGVPGGYIVTRESYSNYKLHAEWRWAEEPANSGVLLHVQEKNLVEWPFCIEAQLKHSNAGDIVLIGTGSGATAKDSVYINLPDERRYKVIPRLEENGENQPGEWNTYDITCDGNNIELIINGVVQNIASEATLIDGRIALQSEGGPIEFRNVFLVPLED